MSKRRKPPAKPAHQPRRGFGVRWIVLAAIALIAFGAVAYWLNGRRPARDVYVPRPQGSITYNKEIAPIFHQHCLNCHRPGESAHLDLVTYGDAKRYAKLIAKVVESRYMPPWL